MEAGSSILHVSINGLLLVLLDINDLANLLADNGLAFNVDAKLINPRSDLKSCEYSLYISWIWSTKHQLPLTDCKSNNSTVKHHILYREAGPKYHAQSDCDN